MRYVSSLVIKRVCDIFELVSKININKSDRKILFSFILENFAMRNLGENFYYLSVIENLLILSEVSKDLRNYKVIKVKANSVAKAKEKVLSYVKKIKRDKYNHLVFFAITKSNDPYTIGKEIRAIEKKIESYFKIGIYNAASEIKVVDNNEIYKENRLETGETLIFLILFNANNE